MGSFTENQVSDHSADQKGKDNPGFDHPQEILPNTKSLDDKYVDLVNNLVPSTDSNDYDKMSALSIPLHEISLSNASSLKRSYDQDNLGEKLAEAKRYDDEAFGKNYDEDEDPEDMRCGIGCFSPEFIQRFATKKMFLIVFSMLGAIQGMTWSYFNATITTLEKRFKISTQTAGIVMTGNEISQILFSVVIAYFGGKGHRPRWISVGVLFSAISCFVLASPQAFFGSGDEMLALTEEYGYLYDSSYSQGLAQTTQQPLSSSLDFPMSSTENDILNMATSTTSTKAWQPNKTIKAAPQSFKKRGRVSVCQPAGLGGGLTHSGSQGGVCADSLKAGLESVSSFAPLIIIFLSQFVSGIGNLLFFSLGGPYLDDNTSRSNMPKVLGFTMSLRLIGPKLGFVTAYGTLKLFVNPLLTPIIAPDDPRWQGAWWLGWVMFGTLMLLMSVFIALFPRRLRRKDNTKSVNPDKINSPEGIPKLADIPLAVKTLLRNKVNLFNNLAGVFYLFSAIGYWTYMPKYLETIFMQTASNASIISGAVGILFQSSGMMLSGILISKFQPSARKLALWNVVIAFVSVAVMMSFTQLGCNVGNIAFGNQNEADGTWNLTTQCNVDCNCKTSKILPVCYKETNTVYYSACHAGCTLYENNTLSNCKCVGDGNATVTLGNCSEGCTGIFILFLAVTALVKFFDSTGRIGNMLISYRCVDLKDRSLSIGLHILLISLFAFLPSPIAFGRIIDSVCLVWGNSTCGGKRGNCMLYDGQQLRYIFNLTAAAFTLIGGLLDCLVLYYVKDMELYTEPEVEKQTSRKSSDDNYGYNNANGVTIPSLKNASSNKNLGKKAGDTEVGGGGGFVNLCFNNEKSE